MDSLPNNLDRWTTDELLAEVLNRNAADRPALRLVHKTIIDALLTESDLKLPPQ